MALTGIVDILGGSAAFQAALRGLRTPAGSAMPIAMTAPDASRGFLLAGLCRGLRRPMLVVTAKPEDADRVSDELAAILGDGEGAPLVLRLPESEALPYERLAEDEAVAHDRLGVLSALLAHAGGGPGLLLVASVAALCQRTLRPDQFQDTTHTLAVGQRVQTGPLLTRWAAMGYVMEPTVETPGTASRRGGILDVYPPARPRPSASSSSATSSRRSAPSTRRRSAPPRPWPPSPSPPPSTTPSTRTRLTPSRRCWTRSGSPATRWRA